MFLCSIEYKQSCCHFEGAAVVQQLRPLNTPLLHWQLSVWPILVSVSPERSGESRIHATPPTISRDLYKLLFVVQHFGEPNSCVVFTPPWVHLPFEELTGWKWENKQLSSGPEFGGTGINWKLSAVWTYWTPRIRLNEKYITIREIVPYSSRDLIQF